MSPMMRRVGKIAFFVVVCAAVGALVFGWLGCPGYRGALFDTPKPDGADVSPFLTKFVGTALEAVNTGDVVPYTNMLAPGFVADGRLALFNPERIKSWHDANENPRGGGGLHDPKASARAIDVERMSAHRFSVRAKAGIAFTDKDQVGLPGDYRQSEFYNLRILLVGKDGSWLVERVGFDVEGTVPVPGEGRSPEWKSEVSIFSRIRDACR